jgi:membrane protein implicated in regulation of membrane protease activity
MRELSRVLVVAGIVLLVAGLVLPFLSRLGLGRLPGDFAIRRPGFSLYVPLATSLILSLLLSLILWFFRR